MSRSAIGDVACSVFALAAGLAIGYVDSRPTWDDTGVTVGAIVVSAGLLALARPRTWWMTGLLIGAPVPIFNFAHSGSLHSVVAPVLALGAAGSAGIVRRSLGPS